MFIACRMGERIMQYGQREWRQAQPCAVCLIHTQRIGQVSFQRAFIHDMQMIGESVLGYRRRFESGLDTYIAAATLPKPQRDLPIDGRIRAGWRPRSFAATDRLREIELPAWEGLTLESVKQDFARQYGMWREQPHLFCMPEGYFPVGALFRRASEFWSQRVSRLPTFVPRPLQNRMA